MYRSIHTYVAQREARSCCISNPKPITLMHTPYHKTQHHINTPPFILGGWLHLYIDHQKPGRRDPPRYPRHLARPQATRRCNPGFRKSGVAWPQQRTITWWSWYTDGFKAVETQPKRGQLSPTHAYDSHNHYGSAGCVPPQQQQQPNTSSRTILIPLHRGGGVLKLNRKKKNGWGGQSMFDASSVLYSSASREDMMI